MLHATLREDGNTLHHIAAESMVPLLDTAGLLAEAINYRDGYDRHDPTDGECGPLQGKAFPLSVVYTLNDGQTVVDEWTIAAKGHFWLSTEKS